MRVEFEGIVKLWPANEKFYLVALPADISAEIFEISDGLTNGWGSLKVEASIEHSVWRTSIFPDKKQGVFEIPLKASIRKTHILDVGSSVTMELEILGL